MEDGGVVNIDEVDGHVPGIVPQRHRQHAEVDQRALYRQLLEKVEGNGLDKIK